MRTLYVAHQDFNSREWIPVAILSEAAGGYELRYTLGASRCFGFKGLGRMTELDQTYFSREIFPFFSNRLISKSRPEYAQYLKWIGLQDGELGDPISVLSVTGGIRATDDLEIFPAPKIMDGKINLDFFIRGIRYLPPVTIELISEDLQEKNLCLMLDLQNSQDAGAIFLRSENPTIALGYVPRYYSKGILQLLKIDPKNVKISVKKVNTDSPLDMRVRCNLTANAENNFDLINSSEDFMPWTKENVKKTSKFLMSGTSLDLS